MKYVDILLKASKIENDYIIVEKPTKKEYGVAIKMTGDPRIQICKINNEKESYSDSFKIDNKEYWINNSIYLNIGCVDKFISSIDLLMQKEL